MPKGAIAPSSWRHGSNIQPLTMRRQPKYLLFIAILAFLTTLQLSSLIQLSGSRKTQEISTPLGIMNDNTLFRKQDAAITSTTAHSCIQTLGKNGTWVQDWNYSQKYGQYSTPLVVPHGPFLQRTHSKFQPSTDAPFSWPSSWKWHDYSQDCQVDYTASAQKWCRCLAVTPCDSNIVLWRLASTGNGKGVTQSNLGVNMYVYYQSHPTRPTCMNCTAKMNLMWMSSWPKRVAVMAVVPVQRDLTLYFPTKHTTLSRPIHMAIHYS